MIPILDERNKRIMEFIEPNKKDEILVIGTGVFPKIEFFLYNKFKCKNITSGDINKKNLNNARKVLSIKFVFLDAQKKFPFKDNFFDKIIFTEVLEHLRDENKALKEIKRVLKNNGRLILSVPKKRWFNFFSPITWIQHKREYTENKITNVLKNNNFKVEKIFVGGCFYDLFNLWIHLILKYFFGILHIDPFFEKKIDESWQKDFKGKGNDIIIKAKLKI